LYCKYILHNVKGSYLRVLVETKRIELRQADGRDGTGIGKNAVAVAAAKTRLPL
jgi:hypothetical protein